jgi:predicted DNA-binding antitoxin AbrB/MazE fold protein
MYAYREILTVADPQILRLKQPLPLAKGQRIEVVILLAEEGEETDGELESIRAEIKARGVTEADMRDALAWARLMREAIPTLPSTKHVLCGC